MIYDNPYCRRVKGSYPLLISCGFCKSEIALYQKVGKGGVLRMYLERVVKSSVNLAAKPIILVCPSCGEQLGTLVTLKPKRKEAYRMIRSAFNSKLLQDL